MPQSRTCPECEQYTGKYLGHHWNSSSTCSHPKLTKEQEEILVGILMGDGTIFPPDQSANHRLQTKMCNKEYLGYVDSKFGIVGCGVTQCRTPEESAELAVSGGYTEADSENYSAMYSWNTRNLPDISRFREWYKSGKKVFPDNLKITPTTLKHWYVCDGSYNDNGSRNYIKISVHNERKQVDKLLSYFRTSGLPEPRVGEREENCKLCWTVSGTKEMFEYMGEPLPGFEYKWSKRPLVQNQVKE